MLTVFDLDTMHSTKEFRVRFSSSFPPNTRNLAVIYSQNRQSIKFQNHENINFVETLYFFILYNQVYIAKHVVKFLLSGFIFRENTSHYKVEG